MFYMFLCSPRKFEEESDVDSYFSSWLKPPTSNPSDEIHRYLIQIYDPAIRVHRSYGLVQFISLYLTHGVKQSLPYCLLIQKF